MDYEKAYKEAFERAKEIHNEHKAQCFDVMLKVFPELKENQTEKIREEIVDYLKKFIPHHDYDLVTKSKQWIAWLEKQGKKSNIHQDAEDDLRRQSTIRILEYARSLDAYNQYGKESINKDIAWLEKQGEKESDPRYENLEEILTADDIYQMSMNDEMVQEAKEKAVNALSGMCIGRLLGLEKQGEQKPNDKVEPKLKVGDFILNGDVTNKGKHEIFKILKVCSSWYDVENIYDGRQTMITFAQEYTCKLWTIQDAKDGDVLVFDDIIMIFKSIKTVCTANTYILYCNRIVVDDWCDFGDDAHPATKEQRDLLFQKMKEAGYEWDFEKKELKKIEQASSWSEDDEVGLDDAMWKIEQAMGNLWRAERWLESVKERMKGE